MCWGQKKKMWAISHVMLFAADKDNMFNDVKCSNNEK